MASSGNDSALIDSKLPPTHVALSVILKGEGFGLKVSINAYAQRTLLAIHWM